MKLQILDKEGKKVREFESKLFEEPIREDIILKVVEAEKYWQPNSTTFRSGIDRSASGNTSKRRHVWKSDRGKGLARLPRKILWRRGTQFSWVATIVPSARGGRKAHPPKGSVNLKKINHRELKKALLSSLSYVNSVNELKKKYASLKDRNMDAKLPFIVEGNVLELKSKEFLESLKKILGDYYGVAIQKKNQRAGIGKMRGRKYKKNAGLLLVIGKDEKVKISGIEIISVDKLLVSDLAGNGARLTLFSEKAVKDLENFREEVSSVSSDKINSSTNDDESATERLTKK